METNLCAKLLMILKQKNDDKLDTISQENLSLMLFFSYFVRLVENQVLKNVIYGSNTDIDFIKKKTLCCFCDVSKADILTV